MLLVEFHGFTELLTCWRCDIMCLSSATDISAFTHCKNFMLAWLIVMRSYGCMVKFNSDLVKSR